MTAWRLIVASLVHHWRTHVAVALGVAAATAVLTGALVVGDSVRASLKRLALDRLGAVDQSLVTDRFFRRELAAELSSADGFDQFFASAVPAIMLEGTVANPDGGNRANRVNILGIDGAFAELAANASDAHFDGDMEIGASEVALNAALTAELGVEVGDEAIVRLPTASDVPRDSPLGKKTETITNRRLTVKRVVPTEGLGGLSLRPNQQTPRNAFVNIETIATTLDQEGKINAILLGGRGGDIAAGAEADRWLAENFHPRLVDFGVTVEQRPLGYLSIGTQRMLFEPALESATEEALAGERSQEVMTYLANTIAAGDHETPYSTIAGIDFDAEPPLGPFVDLEGNAIAKLSDDEIVLNVWAAEDLGASVGDEIRVDYFEPESTHGQATESSATFRLAAVCRLEGAAADPDLTPALPGVTDQLSIADWNPPFPFEQQRIREKDEAYWDDHKATPKALVSLAAAQRLWGSRFGKVTGVRVAPRGGLTAETLAAKIKPDAAAMGFAFFPARRLALAASAGTTSFAGLFIGFSFFIIAAAVMLVALLFRLGVDARAREVGILLAIGIDQRQARRLLIGEALCVAAAGGLVGTALGVAYANLMIVGLTTWWVEAITTPFLRLAVTPTSLVIGFASGVIVSLLAIGYSLRQLSRVAVRRLLADQTTNAEEQVRPRLIVSRGVAVAAILGAIAMAAMATTGGGGEMQALWFFGAGSMVLVAMLAFAWQGLRGGRWGSLARPGRGALARLAVRNVARNPTRSTLIVGLVASASFLIVALSAFRIEPPTALTNKDSGTGGFALVAESDQPIYQDMDTDDGRFDLGFSSRDEAVLSSAQVYELRAQPGDDASCLNLYQPQQPRMVAASPAFIARGGFRFAASAAATDEEKNNPWLLLDKPTASGNVPVIIDAATATYSLKIGSIGATYDVADGQGGTLKLEVVGLLQNSILQGMLLLSEAEFLEHYPSASGYRFFLVGAPADRTAEVEQTLERVLGDYGFDAERTDRRLASFLAVQNTYLSTFQSLGGLGLLLGTFGLAAVELRSVLERRSELALLRATGFRRGLLAWLVMYENTALLVGGLAAGVLAALVAVSPHLAAGSAAVPWASLAGTLAAVLAVGMVASLAAVRAVLAAPVLEALRGD